MLEHAYRAVKNVLRVTNDGELIGAELSLNVLESFPPHWPLAKLTLPLKFGVNRLDRLVAGYLMELRATRSNVYHCRKEISSFAKVLTVRVAMYLAKLIASLLRPVLYHPLMALTDDDTIALYFPQNSGFDLYMKSSSMPLRDSTCRRLLSTKGTPLTWLKLHPMSKKPFGTHGISMINTLQ